MQQETISDRAGASLQGAGSVVPAAGNTGVTIGRHSLLPMVGGGVANGRLTTPRQDVDGTENMGPWAE